MPIYAYACQRCGHRSEEFQKMTSDPLVICPACKHDTYCRVPSLPHTDLKEFHTPIEMMSIALNDDGEIAEFRRKTNGNVDVCDDPSSDSYGIPVARNRKQKLDALRAMGFTEKT